MESEVPNYVTTLLFIGLIYLIYMQSRRTLQTDPISRSSTDHQHALFKFKNLSLLLLG